LTEADNNKLSNLENEVDELTYKSFDEIPDETFAEYKNSIKEIFNNPSKTLILFDTE
jgi:hypothetical protein